MFAKYAVVVIDGVPTPFFVPPTDHSWDRSIMNRDYVNVGSVLGAGFIHWAPGPNPSVTCSGEGFFTDMKSKNYEGKIPVQSRGELDAELFQELMSKPIGYVILKLSGYTRPMFVPAGDTHDRAVLRYQVYPKDCVVSAGMVDFGFAKGAEVGCSGNGEFNTYNNPHLRKRYAFFKESRGPEDFALMESYFKQ